MGFFDIFLIRARKTFPAIEKSIKTERLDGIETERLDRIETPPKTVILQTHACDGCGFAVPDGYGFCPRCGQRQLSQIDPMDDPTSTIVPNENFRKQTLEEHLKRLGLIHMADRLFTVFFQLPDGNVISIELKGQDNGNDAWMVLRNAGYVLPGRHEIADWPLVNSSVDPKFANRSACVCEINLKKAYRIESRNIDREFRHALLYGCPTPRSIKNNAVLDRAKIEVVSYGE